MKREPVRILLNAAAGVVNAVLVALVVFDVLALTGDQIAALVGVVQTGAATVAELTRRKVVSPDTHERALADAA